MYEETEREESEFWRAQEQLHRRLMSAQQLSGSDRTSAERNAWNEYNRRMGTDWVIYGS